MFATRNSIHIHPIRTIVAQERKRPFGRVSESEIDRQKVENESVVWFHLPRTKLVCEAKKERKKKIKQIDQLQTVWTGVQMEKKMTKKKKNNKCGGGRALLSVS